jgi:hypothetical protein
MKNNEIVNDIISEKVMSLVEEMSTNEFLDEVGDKIFKETGNELSYDELKDILNQPIGKLLMKLSEWVMLEK